MNVGPILAELQNERSRIATAIAALEALHSGAVVHQTAPPAATAEKKHGPRSMSAAARRQISEAKREWWAKRRAGATVQAGKPKSPKGQHSAAGRRRIVEAARKMMKARWAAKKKTAAKPHVSAAGRKRLSAIMKARWAARRAAA